MADNPFGAKLKKVGGEEESEAGGDAAAAPSGGEEKSQPSPMGSSKRGSSSVQQLQAERSVARSSMRGDSPLAGSLRAGEGDEEASARSFQDLRRESKTSLRSKQASVPPVPVPVSRQASRTSNAAEEPLPPPSTPAEEKSELGAAVQRQGSSRSIRSSQRSSVAGGIPPLAPYTSADEFAGTQPQPQEEASAPQPEPYAPPPPPQQQDSELLRENNRMKEELAALRRLYEDKTRDKKAHRLEQDIKQKAQRVKELEQENSKLHAEVKKWKSEAAKRRQPKGAKESRTSTPMMDTIDMKAHAEKDARILSLEEELRRALEQVSELHVAAATRQQGEQPHPVLMASRVTSNSDGPAPAPAVPSAAFPQHGDDQVSQLRYQLAERDHTIHDLSERLKRAQDAILSSAGVGWEAHVKLHQTKGMLSKMLKTSASPDPQYCGREPSQPPISCSPSPSRPSPRPARDRVEIKAMEDADGRLKLWRIGGGTKSVITQMRFVNGVIYDQNNEVIRASSEAYGDETPRLSALADLCGVPHTLPQSPVVVVAGHHIGPMITPPRGESRYRSPSRSIR